MANIYDPWEIQHRREIERQSRYEMERRYLNPYSFEPDFMKPPKLVEEKKTKINKKQDNKILLLEDV